jgi:adenylyltransferase/sulfurtransferase
MSARPMTTLMLSPNVNPACVRCSPKDGETFDLETYDYDAFLSSTQCPFATRAEKKVNVSPHDAEPVDLSAPPLHGPGASISNDPTLKCDWLRLSPHDVASILKDMTLSGVTTVVDVRPRSAYRTASIIGSLNIPITELHTKNSGISTIHFPAQCDTLIFVCASGNNSQRAADWFTTNSEASGLKFAKSLKVYDLCGGLDAWRREIDPSFPRF